MKKEFNTPILFIIFNRPDVTNIVFEEIRKIKPQKLFIAADGPRKEKSGEQEKCLETRKIIKKINWKCEVKTLFQEINLGCGLGPVTAINWFFDNVEEGIILEDDCLPDQSFFYFCQELLEYYRNNKKIMHISGNNFQYGRTRGEYSYYFSKYTHNWGWATWRRAWKAYDFEILSKESRKHIWDQQWLITVENNNGLAILPNVNLISNIGFGDNATHTKIIMPYSNLSTKEIIFPLKHPKIIKINILADLFTYKNHFDGNFKKMIIQKIKKYVPSQIKFIIKFCIKKTKETIQNRKLNLLYKKYCEFTMIPKATFCDNLKVVEKFKHVNGCIVECGVWRGGMIAAAAELLGNNRNYYLFDSFEGLPEAKEVDGANALAWQKDTSSPFYFDNCKAEVEFSEKAMKLSGTTNHKIIKGWFDKTLPEFKPDQPIAILRLDSDWYSSTKQCLENLYKHVAPNGIIIIDDYYTWDGCTRAVHEYLYENKLSDRIYTSHNGVCYIIKK